MSAPFFDWFGPASVRAENAVSERIVDMSNAERAAFVAAAAEMVSSPEGFSSTLAILKRATELVWNCSYRVTQHADMLETWLACAVDMQEAAS